MGGAVGYAAAHPPRDDATDRDGESHRSHHQGFRVNGTQVLGRHVSFTVNNATGGVDAFGSRGPFGDTVIFSSMRVTPHVTENILWRASGDQFRLVDSGYAWHALDHKDAQWRLRAFANETVRLVVAPGIDAALVHNGTAIELTHEGHKAYLRASDGATLTLNGGAITARLTDDSSLHFRIALHGHGDKHGSHAHEHHGDDERDAERIQEKIAKLRERIAHLREKLRDLDH